MPLIKAYNRVNISYKLMGCKRWQGFSNAIICYTYKKQDPKNIYKFKKFFNSLLFKLIFSQ